MSSPRPPERAWSALAKLARRAGLALGVALGAPASAQLLADPGSERAVMYLYDAALPESELDSSWLELALADLGAPALPTLFASLADGARSRSSLFHAATSERLTIPQRRATRSAILRLPRRAVRTFLFQLTTEELTLPWRLTALDLAGGLGEAPDLRLVAALALPAPGSEVQLEVREAAQGAFANILSLDPEAPQEARSLFGSLHRDLRAPLVRSVPEAAPDAALEALGSMLSVYREVDPLVLLELGKLARAHPALIPDERLLEKLRGMLDAIDENRLLLAIRAIAGLSDGEAAERLVRLLRHDSDTVRAMALDALSEVTGARMKADPRVWETWLQGELEWFRVRSAEVNEALASADPARVAWGLLEVGKHSLHRDQLAERLLPVLNRPEPDLVAMAAATLGRLESRRSVPYLLDALGSDEPAIREACANAVRAITGGPVPRDPGAWVGTTGR